MSDIGHPHPEGEICNQDCPVGGATGAVKIHFSDTCTHSGRNVCRWCAGLSDDEVAALREYFRVLSEGETRVDPSTGRLLCCGTDSLSTDAFHAAGCPEGETR